MNMIKVLDKGFVSLLNISGPVRRPDKQFDASSIDPAISARISFGNFNTDSNNGRTREQDLKLVKYLIENKHSTPIEMIEIWLEMKLPIFVARQFVRHRTACLVGDTKLIFERPCDGKAYPYRLDSFVSNWRDSSKRPKLKYMKLRMVEPDGTITTTKVIDAWETGVKECFKLVLADGSTIEGSEEHKFKTPNGYVEIKDLQVGDTLYTVTSKGNITKQEYPKFTEDELANEDWVEFVDGFDVSNLGRIRSWYSQGKRSKNSYSTIKLPTLTKQKTAVISARGKVYGVGRLVAENFIGARNAHVLHIDDNVLNNRRSNLYYGDDTDNRRDSIRNGSGARLLEVPTKIVNIISTGLKVVYDINVEHKEHNFVANNIVTHNCINEISGRYVQLPEDWYIPEVVGAKSADKKQGQDNSLDEAAQDWFKHALNKQCYDSYLLYKMALSNNVAPEHARLLLHVNHYTHWVWKQDLHNMIHFLKLRLHEHAQVEAREYASAILELLRGAIPDIMEIAFPDE